MHVIKMNDDKSLITTIKGTIYQNETNADTIVFLLPAEYEENDFADCSLLIRYILPNGIGKSEELEMKPEKYKNYYQYHIKATSKLTSDSGKIELWLCAFNMNDSLILKTGSIYITVTPSKDITDYFSPESKDQLDQLVLKVSKLEKEKADNIMYDSEEKYLQLMSQGTPIGDQIDMSAIDADDEDDEVIDFDSPATDSDPDVDSGTEEDSDKDDSDDVIHF